MLSNKTFWKHKVRLVWYSSADNLTCSLQHGTQMGQSSYSVCACGGLSCSVQLTSLQNISGDQTFLLLISRVVKPFVWSSWKLKSSATRWQSLVGHDTWQSDLKKCCRSEHFNRIPIHASCSFNYQFIKLWFEFIIVTQMLFYLNDKGH